MEKLIIKFSIPAEEPEVAIQFDLSEERKNGELTEAVFDKIFRAGRLSIFRYLADQMGAIT